MLWTLCYVVWIYFLCEIRQSSVLPPHRKGEIKSLGYDQLRVSWDPYSFRTAYGVLYIHKKLTTGNPFHHLRPIPLRSITFSFFPNHTLKLPTQFVPYSLAFVSSAYRVFLTIPFPNIPDTFACFATVLVWHCSFHLPANLSSRPSAPLARLPAPS